MIYLLSFLVSLVLSLLLTPLVRDLAFRVGLVDNPKEEARKIHKQIMPRAGGLVLWPVFFVTSYMLLPNLPKEYWGLMASATLVFLVGLWDDKRRLPAWFKLILQLLAALVAVLGFGLGVAAISNPFGQQLSLAGPQIVVFGTSVAIWSLAFSVVWLVGMTNTINFLDGIDGLATGVGAIAAFVLFLVSLLPRINQPATAILAIILCGACLGFLRYNFSPASIFLGDGGAYFLGMLLGGLAIVSGAKLATALLVLGLPVLDAVWAVIRRLLAHRSPFSADRGHMHYLLLDLGLSQRQVSLAIYVITLSFGLVAIIAGSQQKIVALAIMLTCLIAGIAWLTLRQTNQNKKIERKGRLKN